jgi:hypothetical protein
METLPVYALALVAKMETLPVYALALVAKMETLPVYALALAAKKLARNSILATSKQEPIFNSPTATPRTPTAPYPAANTPHPPASNLCVVELRIALEASREIITLGNQPRMSSM